MGNCGVYKIQSIAMPEICYIGSSKNLVTRIACHFSLLKKGKHFNKRMQDHYNYYGEKDLVPSILCECAKEDLMKMEQSFVDSNGPLFNMQRTIGDNRSQPGKETKSRLIEIPNDFNRTLKVRVLEL